MREDVERLAAPGERLVGRPGHEIARQYLLERMAALGLQAYGGDSFVWPYERDGKAFCNLLGVVPGQDPAAAEIVLLAHYDTFGIQPGADDNAAAIAMSLAIVPRLQSASLRHDMVVALVDAEEPPFGFTPAMGSVHFYRHQRKKPTLAAVSLDLMGHGVDVPGMENAVFITGMESDPGLVKVLEKAAAACPEIQATPSLNAYVGDLSDHHVFRLHQRPYLFLTCGRWQHYHQPSDTPEKLNYEKMDLMADFLFAILTAIDSQSLEGPFEGYDSTEAELGFLNQSLAPLLKQMNLTLRKRKDIDYLVNALVRGIGL